MSSFPNVSVFGSREKKLASDQKPAGMTVGVAFRHDQSRLKPLLHWILNSYICDKIETALTPPDQAGFYDYDRRLRKLYGEFAGRYPGAAMTGLLIADQRLAGRPFLGACR